MSGYAFERDRLFIIRFYILKNLLHKVFRFLNVSALFQLYFPRNLSENAFHQPFRDQRVRRAFFFFFFQFLQVKHYLFVAVGYNIIGQFVFSHKRVKRGSVCVRNNEYQLHGVLRKRVLMNVVSERNRKLPSGKRERFAVYYNVFFTEQVVYYFYIFMKMRRAG